MRNSRFYDIVLNVKKINFNGTSHFPNPIAQRARQYMSLVCGPLFDITNLLFDQEELKEIYLLKISDVCSFGDTSRASEDMKRNIRMTAEDRLFRSGWRFQGKNCRELTASSAVFLSAFGLEGNIINIC